MNPAIKTQWLEALRSGQYIQGIRSLRHINNSEKNQPDKFCCLGVLCDLYAQAHPNDLGWGPQTAFYNVPFLTRFDDEDEVHKSMSYLPVRVRDWAGLDNINPKVRVNLTSPHGVPYEDETNLSKLNDDGWCFNQIADVIEQQL
jgi:hypothetical protein